MQGLRIVVTGATGFIGRALCRRLGDPRTWTAVGRTDAEKQGLPVAFSHADLQDEMAARGAIPDGTDVLVHLAAHRGGPNDATGHFRGTAAATMFLCDAAKRAGVKRVVLASSTSVYEPASDIDKLMTEDAPRVRNKPLAYGYAKKWAEDAARLQAMLASPQMDLWTLRIGMVVGPGLRPSAWLPTTMARLRSGEPYPLVGERGHRLGLVALGDVVDTLAVAIAGLPPSVRMALRSAPVITRCEPTGRQPWLTTVSMRTEPLMATTSAPSSWTPSREMMLAAPGPVLPLAMPPTTWEPG